MKLSILSIEGNKEYEKKKGGISLRSQTYYITEIFMHFLSKIDLDGSDKLVIQFYENPKSKDKYVCDKYFHVSSYNVDKELIDKYSILKKSEFSEFFLDVIVDTFKYIARVNNRGDEVIEMIDCVADKVRECNFELNLIQKNLSKLSADKRYKANVYRKINCLGEMWEIEIENKRKKTLVRYELMEQYAHISKMEFFKKSYWNNDTFIMTDKFNRVVKTIKVDDVE